MTNTSENLLDAEELQLAQTKHSHKNRLAFAVMLKFFQREKCYPTNKSIILEPFVASVASQLGIQTQNLNDFNWSSGSAKRFRQEIRVFLGYKIATVADSEKLIEWLIEHVIPIAPNVAQRDEHVHQFFHDNRLEPFTKKELDNYIRSAMYRFEKKFFSSIYEQLSPDTIQAFDRLLDHDSDEGEEKIKVDISDEGIQFRHLKKDLAGVKLKHVQFEIEKLHHIRNFTLPAQLFGTASRKLIQKYYARIMAALPSNVLEYVSEARYASMACFRYLSKKLSPKFLMH